MNIKNSYVSPTTTVTLDKYLKPMPEEQVQDSKPVVYKGLGSSDENEEQSADFLQYFFKKMK